MANEIGFEKLILKSGTMIGYFVSNQDSRYYQSAKFTRVLEFLKRHHKDASMYEKNGGLRMRFNKVENIEDARRMLENVVTAGVTV